MCSAKAWAATFSLVRIMSFRLGSKTSNPTTRMAAERVLPAPKTPLKGRSVPPSMRARSSAARVAITCSPGFQRSGYSAFHQLDCRPFLRPIITFCRSVVTALAFSYRGILSGIHIGKQQHWQAIPLDSNVSYSGMR